MGVDSAYFDLLILNRLIFLSYILPMSIKAKDIELFLLKRKPIMS